jgi:hypothetical protein
MSFFEFYRMEIPMIVPSPSLLAKWHVSYQVLSERSWNLVFGNLRSSSLIPRFTYQGNKQSEEGKQQQPNSGADVAFSLSWGRNSSSSSLLLSPFVQRREMKSDPNNDLSYEAVLEWISLSDFYQFPFVLQFSSWKELLSLLLTTNFDEISKKMSSFNDELERNHFEKWKKILTSIKEAKEKRMIRNRSEKALDSSSTSGSSRNSSRKSSASDMSSSFSNINRELSKHYHFQLNGCFDQTYG